MLKYEQLSINRRILHWENLSILNESFKFPVVLLYIAWLMETNQELKILKICSLKNEFEFTKPILY